VRARIGSLYGEEPGEYGEPLAEPPGLLHVAAVLEDAEGRWWSWAVGPDAPRCESDAFALGLARARADVIVTTGRIVRSEPGLRHRYAADTALDEALAAWRREALGRPERPRSLVLTASGELPAAHPLWRDGPVEVATGEAGAAALAAAGRPWPRRVLAAPGLGAVVAALRGEGHRTVLVEAGPATTREALYGAGGTPPDELMLSRLSGAQLPAARRGRAFADPARVAALLPRRIVGPPERAADGVWHFERRLRAPGGQAVHSSV